MKHVILGITGGIAAYKTPELIRQLKKQGYRVTPVLTNAALEFVSPLSLEVVAQEKVFCDEDRFSADSLHLSLARDADFLVIAPATANSLAKYAQGIADDLLSTLVLSFTKPRLIVPAMHTEMWENPATQRNMAQLVSDGFLVLGPVVGDLASGDYGKGRMVDLESIVDRLALLSLPPLFLTGKKVLISSGGTIEPLDTVRAITNFSTGKMGQSLAKVATFFGAEVTLVSTQPVDDLLVHETIVAKTVVDLERILSEKIASADVLIMAAAVSDFRPKAASDVKLKREAALSLELEGTPDILKSLSAKKGSKIFIGFCLADDDLENVALDKLKKKGLDFIVANRSDMFGNDHRTMSLYQSGFEKSVAHCESLPLLEAAYFLLHHTLS